MRSLTVAALGASMLLASAPAVFANCAKDDPTGSKVLAARQQATTMCPCTGTTHGAYVSCVAGVAEMLSSGTNPSLPKSCKGAVKKCAAHSTCGKPGTPVTCCFTTAKGPKCKVKKDAAHCTTKQGMVGSCTSCCDACPTPGSGPSCGTGSTTTTTTIASCSNTPTGTVVKGSLTATPGRFNYNSTVGLPGASAACSTNFPGSHVCSITDLQGAPTSDLACLKDTAGMTVTSFWAIAADAATNPSLQQCEDDVTSGLNWEYATAHTASRGQKVSLDNATGALGTVQSGVQCNISGNAWVGCCQ